MEGSRSRYQEGWSQLGEASCESMSTATHIEVDVRTLISVE